MTVLTRTRGGSASGASDAELAAHAADTTSVHGIADTAVLQRKTVQFEIAVPGSSPTTGDGKAHIVIPPEWNGFNLIDADAMVSTVSSSGTPTFAVRRERSGSAVDMLSTNITIDVSEKTSYTAATQPVINGSNDDVATGDIIYIDLDVVGTSAAGHLVVLTFGP